MPSDPKIPLERVAGFVRQHTHDVRNGLNGLDLEAALLLEIVTEEEARAGVQRMRTQMRGLAEQLRALGTRFQEPQPHRAPLPARELLAILREQHAGLADAPEVAWSEAAGEVAVDVDPMMVVGIFRELWSNAIAFPANGPIRLRACRKDDAVVIELTEPKIAPLDPRDWGEVPFSGTRRGGYGLGLWTAHRLAEASGLQFTQEMSSAGELVTRLRLSVA
jgi:signal transduction histidine kinase